MACHGCRHHSCVLRREALAPNSTSCCSARSQRPMSCGSPFRRDAPRPSRSLVWRPDPRLEQGESGPDHRSPHHRRKQRDSEEVAHAGRRYQVRLPSHRRSLQSLRLHPGARLRVHFQKNSRFGLGFLAAIVCNLGVTGRKPAVSGPQLRRPRDPALRASVPRGWQRRLREQRRLGVEPLLHHRAARRGPVSKGCLFSNPPVPSIFANYFVIIFQPAHRLPHNGTIPALSI